MIMGTKKSWEDRNWSFKCSNFVMKMSHSICCCWPLSNWLYLQSAGQFHFHKNKLGLEAKWILVINDVSLCICQMTPHSITAMLETPFFEKCPSINTRKEEGFLRALINDCCFVQASQRTNLKQRRPSGNLLLSFFHSSTQQQLVQQELKSKDATFGHYFFAQFRALLSADNRSWLISTKYIQSSKIFKECLETSRSKLEQGDSCKILYLVLMMSWVVPVSVFNKELCSNLPEFYQEN